jgi:C_GCAxxG_C_C family probable redox protein
MEDEDYLWAGIPFIGGIAGHQDAPCGAISASTVFIGLNNRCSSTEKEKAKSGREKARTEATEFVRDFKKEFEDINCLELVGYDFTDKAAAEKAKEAGEGMANCPKYIEFALEKIYEFENRG